MTTSPIRIYRRLSTLLGAWTKQFYSRLKGLLVFYLISLGFYQPLVSKINLGGAGEHITGYYNIDLNPQADLVIDLEQRLLPFADNTVEVLVCISTINYFTRARAQQIISDVYRALKPGAITRFATQDFELIVQKYLAADRDFFYQRLASGAERFKGATMVDKINTWFYGYEVYAKHCQYFYDFETLALLFQTAGFTHITKKAYQDSVIAEIALIDNRPEQMFYLEAIK